MEYYGIASTPNDDFLAHYGIKGMKWGVRRALDRGDNKAIEKHYRKANKKLNSLKKKADVIYNLNKRKDAYALIGAGVIPAAAGIATPLAAKKWNYTKFDTADKVTSAFNTAAGLGIIGLGAHDLVTGSARSKSKSHDKAVRKVNEWQKGMKETFKGTKYEAREKARPDYNDQYTLYEYGTLGKDKNGKAIVYRAPTVSISGSSLVRDVNSKAKEIFKKRLTDPPVTKSFGSKVNLIVHTPAGQAYSADHVNELIKIKKKKRRHG